MAELHALALFDNHKHHTSTEVLVLLEVQENHSYTADSHKHWLFGGLHSASVFGIVGILFGGGGLWYQQSRRHGYW